MGIGSKPKAGSTKDQTGQLDGTVQPRKSFEPLSLPEMDLSLTKGTNIPRPEPSPPPSVKDASVVTKGQTDTAIPAAPTPATSNIETPKAADPARASVSRQSTTAGNSKKSGVRSFFSRLISSKAASAANLPSSECSVESLSTTQINSNEALVAGTTISKQTSQNRTLTRSPTVSARRRSLLPFFSSQSASGSKASSNRESKAEMIEERAASVGEGAPAPPAPTIPVDVLWGVVSSQSRNSLAVDGKGLTDRRAGRTEIAGGEEVGSSFGLDTDELFRRVS